MTHLFYLLLILSEYFIHDNSDGTITCYIAGGAETVHCNIEGYHECLHIGIETQITSTMAGILISKNGLSSSTLSTAT